MRQPVCRCRYAFPPIWSALEWVLLIAVRCQPLASRICRTFRPASLGPDAAADPGGRDFGEGDARDTGHGAVRVGSLSASASCKIGWLKTAGGLRATGGLPFFLAEGPEERAYSPPASGRWYCLTEPCALRGGLWLLREPLDDATARRRCCHHPRSRSPVMGGKTPPHTVTVCLHKPATGSFAAVMDASLSGGAPIFFLRKRSKNSRAQAAPLRPLLPI